MQKFVFFCQWKVQTRKKFVSMHPTPQPSLPRVPLLHPLFTPTQEFPLHRQMQIIGLRFLLAGHKGTSYSLLCKCLLPVLTSLLRTSCIPSNRCPTTIGPERSCCWSLEHSPFSVPQKSYQDAWLTHDPDPQPDPAFLRPEASITTNRPLNLFPVALDKSCSINY